MKKILFLFASMALFCGQILFAQDHHWPLKENLNDIVGGLDGTNHGVTFVNDAIRGPVAYFDGDVAYANLPSFVNGLTEITISCWFRMDESRVWARIYSFGNGDQTEPKDVMMVIPVSGNNNMYRFTLSNPGDIWYDIDFPKDIVDIQLNTWYSSIVVLKPDSIILYHNGEQIFAEGGFTRAFGTIQDTQNALGKSFWPDPLWKGALSDLRVYNKALTKEEAVALYNATKITVGVRNNKVTSEAPLVYASNNKINVKMNKSYNDEYVSVYNLTGALVAQKSVPEINKISFKNGIYIVKVQGSNVNYVTKVLIK